MAFFVIFTTVSICFTQEEKKCVKVIDDDIKNKILKYKIKKEMIKMKKIKVTLTKKYKDNFKMKRDRGKGT